LETIEKEKKELTLEERKDEMIVSINLAYQEYLEKTGFSYRDIKYSENLISDLVDRYFMDVKRLHEFHGIKHIDCHKIAGYVTYWICKIRPFLPDISAYCKTQTHCKAAPLANEFIALIAGLGRINDARKDDPINILGMMEFYKPFFYTLRFRKTDPDSLSMIYYFIDKTTRKK